MYVFSISMNIFISFLIFVFLSFISFFLAEYKSVIAIAWWSFFGILETWFSVILSTCFCLCIEKMAFFAVYMQWMHVWYFCCHLFWYSVHIYNTEYTEPSHSLISTILVFTLRYLTKIYSHCNIFNIQPYVSSWKCVFVSERIAVNLSNDKNEGNKPHRISKRKNN